MTNYPRDEFDRVPEFNTRVGSHRAHGWAQSAALKSPGAKILWVVLAALIVLIIGAFFFFFSPQLKESVAGASATMSTQPLETNEEVAVLPTPDITVPPTSSVDPDDVLLDDQVGVYNASNIEGNAGAGEKLLIDAGFTNTKVDNWLELDDISAVYYMYETYRPTAERVAEVLNIQEVMQTDKIPNRVAVVFGTDDALRLKN